MATLGYTACPGEALERLISDPRRTIQARIEAAGGPGDPPTTTPPGGGVEPR